MPSHALVPTHFLFRTLFSLAVLTFPLLTSVRAVETQFFIVRHAEKVDESKDPALSSIGHERAEQLKQTLAHLRIEAIYSTDFSRTKQTVQPLAELLGIDIRLYTRPSSAWSNELVQQHQGKRILIVGHSNTITEIASLLSGKQLATSGDEYDNIYVVSVADDAKEVVRLKYGQAH